MMFLEKRTFRTDSLTYIEESLYNHRYFPWKEENSYLELFGYICMGKSDIDEDTQRILLAGRNRVKL